MPLYDFGCPCGYDSSEMFRMADAPKGPRKCPGCGKRSLSRLLGAPQPKTSKTLKTFGQQSEANMKDLGKEGLDYLKRSQARERYNKREKAREEMAAEVGAKAIKLPKKFEDNGPEDKSLVSQVKKTLGKPSGN